MIWTNIQHRLPGQIYLHAARFQTFPTNPSHPKSWLHIVKINHHCKRKSKIRLPIFHLTSFDWLKHFLLFVMKNWAWLDSTLSFYNLDISEFISFFTSMIWVMDRRLIMSTSATVFAFISISIENLLKLTWTTTINNNSVWHQNFLNWLYNGELSKIIDKFISWSLLSIW